MKWNLFHNNGIWLIQRHDYLRNMIVYYDFYYDYRFKGRDYCNLRSGNNWNNRTAKAFTYYGALQEIKYAHECDRKDPIIGGVEFIYELIPYTGQVTLIDWQDVKAKKLDHNRWHGLGPQE